jgi:hypothetical protein
MQDLNSAGMAAVEARVRRAAGRLGWSLRKSRAEGGWTSIDPTGPRFILVDERGHLCNWGDEEDLPHMLAPLRED